MMVQLCRVSGRYSAPVLTNLYFRHPFNLISAEYVPGNTP